MPHVFSLHWVRSAIYHFFSHFISFCPFLSVRFFVLSDDVVSHGGPWEPAKNATFLNTQETQCEPQFLLGVAVQASAELRGPAFHIGFTL